MVVRSIRTGVLPVSVVVTTAPMAPRSTLATTSESEITIGPGERAFDVSGIAGFSVAPGVRLRATAAGGVVDWLEGPVVSYDGTSVVIHVDRMSGEGGTFDDWHIGVIGNPGEQGPIGERGPAGTPGPATIDVDPATITTDPGNPALVDNTGDTLHAKLRFTLPRGAPGQDGQTGDKGDKGDKGDTGTAATITVVSTTTLPSGGSASVNNVGDAQDVKLEFTIPSGGPPGPTGPPGPAIAVVPPFDTLPGGELTIDVEPPLEIDNNKLTFRGPRAFQ